ncbi:MAG: NAD(P)/FAD-dependent oxidoreductase [Bacteroidota bacterium]|jgi:glycine oxidase
MKVLLIGYGFAGASLAYFLSKKNVHVTIHSFSPFDNTCSTVVSAGMMIPLSGRRKVPSFNVHKVMPYSLSHYSSLAIESGLDINIRFPVVQLLYNHGEMNDWQSKSVEPYMSDFIGSIHNTKLNSALKPHIGYVMMKSTACIHPRNVLLAYAALSKNLERHDLKIDLSNPSDFENNSFDYVIFCDGYRAINNPLWKSLPFQPVKGEIIDIIAPTLNLNYILNGDSYLIPQGNNRYLLGSTYNWTDLDEIPSEHGLNKLRDATHKLLNCSFDVVAHRAGVRPAILDRKPIIGLHPDKKRIGIFNGLGTKGAMFSPYYAKQLADHLVDGLPLDAETDVKRFFN